MDPLTRFHPAVSNWFRSEFGAPTLPQAAGWSSIHAGKPTLIAAPTGSGKTLAAFLSAIDDLVCLGIEGRLRDEVRVVYVSPLRALSNDIRNNLEVPIEGIRRHLSELGLKDVALRVTVRTGDTPQKDRAKVTNPPPHILVTTPESLFILLTSAGGRCSRGRERSSSTRFTPWWGTSAGLISRYRSNASTRSVGPRAAPHSCA